MNYEQLMERFNEIGITDLFGTKKEVKELPKILKENEEVMYATSGLMDGNTWLIVCTSARVLFIDKGMLYGIKQVEITHDKINSISFKTGMIFGEIHIYHGSAQMLIKNVSKKTIKPMIDAINRELEKLNQTNDSSSQIAATSDADEIKKFKELLDMGAITQEEFDAKKKQLLGI